MSRRPHASFLVPLTGQSERLHTASRTRRRIAIPKALIAFSLTLKTSFPLPLPAMRAQTAMRSIFSIAASSSDSCGAVTQWMHCG
jgi:hypothetical protein